MSGRAGTQMMVLHCTAKGFCLIVPPSFFSTFFLILQDFGYFLSRQGAGQAEEVQRFGGGDRVPGDTPARYSPASPAQRLLCCGQEGLQRLGVSERTGNAAGSHGSANPRSQSLGVMSGGCKTSSATA